MIKQKELSQDQINLLLELTNTDITLKKLKELFATTENRKKLFNPNDQFLLPINKLNNKNTIFTTVGRYIYNLFIMYPKLIQFTEYINWELNKDGLEKLEGILAKNLLENKITVEDFIEYINKSQWLGFSLSLFITPSLSYKIIKPVPEVVKRKQELEKQYRKEILDGDPYTSTKMEQELLGIAKEKLVDVPEMDLFNSGASKGFNNAYKNISVMRGAIRDNARPGKYYVSTSNLYEGIKKEEYYQYADMPVLASYSRAISTQEGGYLSKQLNAAYQTVILGEKDSDCGSKGFLNIELTGKNKDMFLYRYIIEGNKLICLDSETISKYLEQTVKMRSPLFCTDEHICNKCAGDLYFLLGLKNIGLLMNRVGTRMMNLALKKFHDTTIKVNKIDIDNYII